MSDLVLTEKSNHGLGRAALFIAGGAAFTALAAYLATLGDVDPNLPDLAQLVWLVGPTLMGVLILTITKQWKSVGLSFKVASSPSYLIAIVMPVLMSALLLGVAQVVTPSYFAAGPMVGAGIGAAIAMTFFKNLFEEFCWRGVLTPQLAKTSLHPLVAHVITGLAWSLWHLPYWFIFLGASEILAASGMNVTVFTLTAIIGLTLQSILYGELRLKSGSVWTAYVMHTVANLVSFVFPIIGYAHLQSNLNFILTPESFGLVYSLGYAAVGIALMRQRLRAA